MKQNIYHNQILKAGEKIICGFNEVSKMQKHRDFLLALESTRTQKTQSVMIVK